VGGLSGGPEFRPAFEAWVATKPRTNPRAPLSPFAMPEYKLAASATSDRLEGRAAAFSQRAGDFIQRADNYALAGVLFAEHASGRCLGLEPGC
jgi:hypothetical protein